MAPRVVASHTGPNQGLTAIVPRDSPKAFSTDDAVQFIDDSPKKTGMSVVCRPLLVSVGLSLAAEWEGGNERQPLLSEL